MFSLFGCREVQCIWKAKIGPEASVAPVEKILPLFNDLQIFPTNTQGKPNHISVNFVSRHEIRNLKIT